MKLPSTRHTRPTLQMHRFLPSFAATLLLAIAITPLHAQDSNDGLLRRGPGPRGLHQPQPSQPTPQQSALPPTQPTTAPAPPPTPTPTVPVITTPDGATILNAPAPHRALVIFANGQLEVRADNSSLLQVLHDIHRLTGMNIIGGVAEQHIFGDYGPASPSTVLATLLDGSGANMLLRQDPVTGAPVELELSQRAGAAPPTSPLGPGFDDSPFPTQATAPSQPTPTIPQPQSVVHQPQPVAPPVNVVNVTPTSTNTPPKSGTSTPESIYQQLIQMQQARAKAAGTTPAPTPPPATNPPQ